MTLAADIAEVLEILLEHAGIHDEGKRERVEEFIKANKPAEVSDEPSDPAKTAVAPKTAKDGGK